MKGLSALGRRRIAAHNDRVPRIGLLRHGGTMTGLTRPLAGAVPMDSPGTFLHWGVIQISVANLVVIILMLVVFVAALLLPFPGRKK
jgi:hypothetical protein